MSLTGSGSSQACQEATLQKVGEIPIPPCHECLGRHWSDGFAESDSVHWDSWNIRLTSILYVKHTFLRPKEGPMALTKNRLREAREGLGLTQERLAERAGVSRQTINSIEAGRYVPSLELALTIGQLFGCAVEDLFGIQEVQRVRKA